MKEASFIKDVAVFMDEGGIFMWVIFIIWSLGIGIVLERAKSLLIFDIDGVMTDGSIILDDAGVHPDRVTGVQPRDVRIGLKLTI